MLQQEFDLFGRPGFHLHIADLKTHLAPSPALKLPDENAAQRRDNHLRDGDKELTKQAGAPTYRISEVHPRGCFNASGVKRLAEPLEGDLGLETADSRLVGPALRESSISLSFISPSSCVITSFIKRTAAGGFGFRAVGVRSLTGLARGLSARGIPTPHPDMFFPGCKRSWLALQP